MRRLLVVVCTTVLSAAGALAGASVGPFTAFTLSMVGLGVGLYAGRWLADRWGG